MFDAIILAVTVSSLPPLSEMPHTNGVLGANISASSTTSSLGLSMNRLFIVLTLTKGPCTAFCLGIVKPPFGSSQNLLTIVHKVEELSGHAVSGIPCSPRATIRHRLLQLPRVGRRDSYQLLSSVNHCWHNCLKFIVIIDCAKI